MADNNDELFKNIEEFLNKTLPDALEKGMAQACIQVEGTARENCPVDDGQLRQSITHDVQREKDGVEGYVGTNVEYAP